MGDDLTFAEDETLYCQKVWSSTDTEHYINAPFLSDTCCMQMVESAACRSTPPVFMLYRNSVGEWYLGTEQSINNPFVASSCEPVTIVTNYFCRTRCKKLQWRLSTVQTCAACLAWGWSGPKGQCYQTVARLSSATRECQGKHRLVWILDHVTCCVQCEWVAVWEGHLDWLENNSQHFCSCHVKLCASFSVDHKDGRQPTPHFSWNTLWQVCIAFY